MPVLHRSRDDRRRPPLRFALPLGIAALLAAPLAVGSARAAPVPEGVSAPADRVDRDRPVFSHPTRITNPLFPITRVTQAVQLGHEADASLRHEITLIDEIKVFHWRGQRIETVVSQFVAYSDGQIAEVAYDYFAQADDGAVWYFGEHVANYADGVLDNHDGTWLAGRDGPPGMIMPSDPQVGDVYRPENIPGLVFEEVTVKAIDQTVAGPRGPVHGAIVVQERLSDGTLEDKTFAPSYGEFSAHVPVEDELVTVAVAVPTDSIGGATPPRLRQLSHDAARVFADARSASWRRLAAKVGMMTSSWGDFARPVPPLLAEQMDDALGGLQEAVADRQRGDVRQAAIDVELAALDLRLQYSSPARIDHRRLEAWARQLRLDRSEHDGVGVASDRVILDAIAERLDDDDCR